MRADGVKTFFEAQCIYIAVLLPPGSMIRMLTIFHLQGCGEHSGHPPPIVSCRYAINQTVTIPHTYTYLRTITMVSTTGLGAYGSVEGSNTEKVLQTMGQVATLAIT